MKMGDGKQGKLSRGISTDESDLGDEAVLDLNGPPSTPISSFRSARSLVKPELSILHLADDDPVMPSHLLSEKAVGEMFNELSNDVSERRRTSALHSDPGVEIYDRVYLGSAACAADKIWLDTNQITHVINCSKEVPNYHPMAIEYHRIPVSDHDFTDLTEQFELTTKLIARLTSQPDRRVLVHCQAGISRSATIVIAYLIYSGMDLDEAFRHTKARRKYVQPNAGFWQQLQQFAVKCRKEEKQDFKLADPLSPSVPWTQIAIVSASPSISSHTHLEVQDSFSKLSSSLNVGSRQVIRPASPSRVRPVSPAASSGFGSDMDFGFDSAPKRSMDIGFRDKPSSLTVLSALVGSHEKGSFN